MFCAILGATVLVVCLHWTGNTRGGSEAAVAEDTSRRRRRVETMLDQVPGLTEA